MAYLFCYSICFIFNQGSFSLLCCGFFFVLFYTTSFLLTMYLKQGPIMKKIIFSFLIFTLLSCQEDRPHGNQYKLPELTPNNFLMGNLNENRSSYRVSYYDINIDFDIEKKSLNGFVTVKAESKRDLGQLQIDLAENLNIKKITYKNQELSFKREFDAVLIDFSSTIKKIVFLILLFFMKVFLKAQIIHLGQEALHGPKIKMVEIGFLFLVKVKVRESGGPIKIISQRREIV